MANRRDFATMLLALTSGLAVACSSQGKGGSGGAGGRAGRPVGGAGGAASGGRGGGAIGGGGSGGRSASGGIPSGGAGGTGNTGGAIGSGGISIAGGSLQPGIGGTSTSGGSFTVGGGGGATSGGSPTVGGAGGATSTSGGFAFAGGAGGAVGGRGGGSGGGGSGGTTASGGNGGFGGAGGQTLTWVAVNYPPDDGAIFANPERGFYHFRETRGSSYAALDAAELTGFRTSEAMSLIYRIIYLDAFRTGAIGSAYLNGIAADFTAIRSAGMKAVVRFAYTDSATVPHGDASKDTVLGHIAQLAPLLQSNADVIVTLQAGFIGAWGEWYYTDYFGDNGTVSASQWADRQAVVDALLGALPVSRTIQLRTPAYKQHFYGTAPLSSAEAFTGAAKSRVGHHNDCFLADQSDMGTYQNVTADKAYLAAENLYVPQGGETCATSAYSDWTHADADMSMLHYSYLNRDYNTDVLGGWGTNLDIARRKLGYRIVLVKGAFTAAAQPGGEVGVDIDLRNDGYAPPFNPRLVEVLLRNKAGGARYTAQLPADPRRFVPGTPQKISASLCLPSDLPLGTYELLLVLPDAVVAIHDRPEYSIRVANPGLGEATTGYNRLQQDVTVTTAGGVQGCSAGSVQVVARP